MLSAKENLVIPYNEPIGIYLTKINKIANIDLNY
jgi:hypothetical protein